MAPRTGSCPWKWSKEREESRLEVHSLRNYVSIQAAQAFYELSHTRLLLMSWDIAHLSFQCQLYC